MSFKNDIKQDHFKHDKVNNFNVYQKHSLLNTIKIHF